MYFVCTREEAIVATHGNMTDMHEALYYGNEL